MILTLVFCGHLGCVTPQWPLTEEAHLPFHCARAAQTLAVDWLQTHPGYQLRRYECMPGEKLQRNA